MRNSTRALASITAASWAAAACVENRGYENPALADDFLGSGAPITTVVEYDDFSDGTTYGERWFDVSTFLSIGEPQIPSGRTFTGGELGIGTTQFTTSYDLVLDHMKYFAQSTEAFDIPVAGGVMVSADIEAQTPGAQPGRVNPITGRVLKEGQQGAATLDLIDADGSGLHLAWWVSGHKAFALYERLMPEGSCTLTTAFTQILGERTISPGPHNYAIEYRRTAVAGQADMVRFILDGTPVAFVNNVGVPHDVTTGHPLSTYPSQGPGQVLKNNLSAFLVGHGIGTMVDEFPFNQCPTGQVSIPADQRAFGQGVTATYDNVRVTTIRPSSGGGGGSGGGSGGGGHGHGNGHGNGHNNHGNGHGNGHNNHHGNNGGHGHGGHGHSNGHGNGHSSHGNGHGHGHNNSHHDDCDDNRGRGRR